MLIRVGPSERDHLIARPGHDLHLRLVFGLRISAVHANLHDERIPEVIITDEFHKINQFSQKQIIFPHFFFAASGQRVERSDIVAGERQLETARHDRDITGELSLLRQDITVVGHVKVISVVGIEPHNGLPLGDLDRQDAVDRRIDAGRTDIPPPPDETLQFERIDRRELASDQRNLLRGEPSPHHGRRDEPALGAVEHHDTHLAARSLLLPLARVARRQQQIDEDGCPRKHVQGYDERPFQNTTLFFVPIFSGKKTRFVPFKIKHNRGIREIRAGKSPVCRPGTAGNLSIGFRGGPAGAG